jgi:hypothetical protein
MTVPDNPIYYLEALDRAEVFYGAFRQLPPEETITKSWPRYFLLCHAIELALDAFLASRGVKPKDLQNPSFGHKIAPLMDDAIVRGLKIGTSAADAIKRLDEGHRNYWARYPRLEGGPIFVIEEFEPYVVELLKAVAMAIRGPNTIPPYATY